MFRRIVKLACALAVALATMLATVLATALPANAGATITYRQALKSNGAVLQTALSDATIKVKASASWSSSRTTTPTPGTLSSLRQI